MKNSGKQFERDWSASVPPETFCLRLNDPAQAFGGNSTTRFAPHNPCDYIMFRFPCLFALELKSTKGTSLTFWRDGREGQFMIKKWQVEGLASAARVPWTVAGFVINLRRVERTYFCDIERFVEYTGKLDKKSINEADIIAMGGMLIGQRQLKVNWRYDVEEFIDVTCRQRSGEGTGGAGTAGGRRATETLADTGE